MNKIEITKVVGTTPVPSHGGLARPIYWQLRLNNEVLEEETVRVEWTADPDQFPAPATMRILHDNISKALRYTTTPADHAMVAALQPFAELVPAAFAPNYSDDWEVLLHGDHGDAVASLKIRDFRAAAAAVAGTIVALSAADTEMLLRELDYWLRVIGDRIGAERRFSDMVKDLDGLVRGAQTQGGSATVKDLLSKLNTIMQGSVSRCLSYSEADYKTMVRLVTLDIPAALHAPEAADAECERLRSLLLRCMAGANAVDLGGGHGVIALYLRGGDGENISSIVSPAPEAVDAKAIDREVVAAVQQSITTAFDLLRRGAKDLDPSSRYAWKEQVELYLRGNGVAS